MQIYYSCSTRNILHFPSLQIMCKLNPISPGFVTAYKASSGTASSKIKHLHCWFIFSDNTISIWTTELSSEKPLMASNFNREKALNWLNGRNNSDASKLAVQQRFPLKLPPSGRYGVSQRYMTICSTLYVGNVS